MVVPRVANCLAPADGAPKIWTGTLPRANPSAVSLPVTVMVFVRWS
jgi:hypothetical protein